MLRALVAVGLGCSLICSVIGAEFRYQLLNDIQPLDDLPPSAYLDEDNYLRDPERMIRVRKAAGNCYAQGKCLYYSKRMKGEFCGTCGKRGSCFPGSATVLKESGEVTPMTSLRVDDRVLAASRSGELTFSPVVTWLDKRSNDTTQYLEVSTETGHRLRLSPNHVLLVNEQQELVSRFASDICPGDLLKVADSDSDSESSWSPVTDVRPLVDTGAFVPLTAEGTIVVDGVLASCYASFDHDWAHLLTTPVRWFPWLFEGEEEREADGPRAAVEQLKELGRWLFPEPGSKNRAAPDDTVIQLTDNDAGVIRLPLMASLAATSQ
ncbi:Tiggy-winkle hedgehog protein [Amphibalanus amphitrite]|uniref:Tiggy-winkle hedgehog protein n=1 Tax=Amphibalanus amphitrite TaxID=1232801 RepID=A0A6A4VVJ2_AMPAM|nr:Tiggy-winkle hedgehog protein [Amphibalanus amphitrite]